MHNNKLSLNVNGVRFSAMPGDATTSLNVSLSMNGMDESPGSILWYIFELGSKVPGGAGLAASMSAKKVNYRIFKLDSAPEVLSQELLSFNPETGKGMVRLTCRINSMIPDSRNYSLVEKQAMRELVLDDSPKDISMQAGMNIMAKVMEEDTELVITFPVALFQ
jgi:hypothetical protein